MKKILILVFFISVFSKNLTTQVYLSTINEVINLALQNKEYVYEKRAVQQNMQLSKFSFRDFLPSLGVSFSESDGVEKNALDSRSKNLQLSPTQRVFDGGKTRLTYDMGKINAFYALQEYTQKERLFLSEVLSVYYAYLKQREVVNIQTTLIENARTQLVITETETELGFTLKTDYLEYAISFLSLENTLEQSIQELEKLERKLKVLLGLNAETVVEITGTIKEKDAYMPLTDYFDTLWNLVRTNSSELKKQTATVSFFKKQYDLSKRWYLPTIFLEGGMSFSGKTYPLTMPKYYLKMIVNFENNKLFPTSFSNGYGLKNDDLQSVQNSFQTQLLSSSTVFIENKINELKLLQKNLELEKTENDLYEALYDTLVSYDAAISNIALTKKSIELSLERLSFRKIELENGDIKPIDYLNDLTKLSQQKIALVDLITQVSLLERSLEISAYIPFGELEDVRKK